MSTKFALPVTACARLDIIWTILAPAFKANAATTVPVKQVATPTKFAPTATASAMPDTTPTMPAHAFKKNALRTQFARTEAILTKLA